MVSAFVAMAVLSARTWVRVPPMTEEFFACNNVSPLTNRTLRYVPCASIN